MFSAAVQPALVSLFSSTGSEPLTLFSSHVDKSLPSDSCICLLEDSTSLPPPPPPAILVAVDSAREQVSQADRTEYVLNQTVLHIQSPSLQTTYIRCPPAGWSRSGGSLRMRTGDLGIEHPWIHLQVRNLQREWSFEVGVVDRSGREGIVRCSTFQVYMPHPCRRVCRHITRAHHLAARRRRRGDPFSHKEPQLKLGKRPLLHLPLNFPPPSSNPLTCWSTITLNLPQFLPHFSSASMARRVPHEDDAAHDESSTSSDVPHVSSRPIAVPSGGYSHVSYVKVYATCRLRHIFFTENGPRQELPWEFGLYSAD
ncbi:hypothetical protein FOMPIDRAFT_63733 [Fomitopsis schrenkii]|uniref:CFA20 domain-containing protein n=1 Tax=Fomitopsis schrenkii TaxID=2126942 RepID=S8F571_FOMSC|nr:hypothetical protein FOMPIDRAFT_63733 [Fomitopsis schrenkii]